MLDSGPARESVRSADDGVERWRSLMGLRGDDCERSRVCTAMASPGSIQGEAAAAADAPPRVTTSCGDDEEVGIPAERRLFSSLSARWSTYWPSCFSAVSTWGH